MKGLIALALLLAGCSATAPFRGSTEDGSESFSGTTTGYMDGSGVVTITSTKGRQCTGQFFYTTPRSGSGTFQCSDGTSGVAEFVSNGTRGTGFGRLGNQRFTFSFG